MVHPVGIQDAVEETRDYEVHNRNAYFIDGEVGDDRQTEIRSRETLAQNFQDLL